MFLEQQRARLQTQTRYRMVVSRQLLLPRIKRRARAAKVGCPYGWMPSYQSGTALCRTAETVLLRTVSLSPSSLDCESSLSLSSSGACLSLSSGVPGSTRSM